MIWWIVTRNLRSRFTSTVLAVLAVALAVTTALVVPLVTRQVERGAANAAQVFDLLITSKGSATQAVLSSLFYLDVPLGNMPYAEYQHLARDSRTRRAVPLGFGDQYRGFPMVGTSARFFEQRLKPDAPPYFTPATGRVFERPFEAVVGATVAQAAGLKIGTEFHSAHGTQPAPHEEQAEHDAEYTVVGVLAPTGGSADRAIYVDLASLWVTHAQNTPETRGVTAVLFTADNIAGLYAVAQELNASPAVQAVFPGQVFAQLRGTLSQGQAAYAALSVLVLLLATLTVWLGVHASSLERARTVALLRALGATRHAIFAVVLAETLMTVLAGLFLGVLLGYGVSAVAAPFLTARLGFALPAPELSLKLLTRVALLVPLALLAALPPALAATRQSPTRSL